MRRHLLLVRHAKSAWEDPSLADQNRPLSPRGEKALPLLREYLTSIEPQPGIVFCSSSRRTVDTLDGIRATIPTRAQVEVEDDLYLASAATLLGRLHSVNIDATCAMMIGHNPGIQDLALLLVGAGDAAMRAQLSAKLPTGAIAVLSFDGRWADLASDTVQIVDLFMPRPPRQ
jgi:phosphohistidine phosphatase